MSLIDYREVDGCQQIEINSPKYFFFFFKKEEEEEEEEEEGKVQSN